MPVMSRAFAIAAMFALAVPTLAVAQGGPPPGKGKGKPPPGRPALHVVPHVVPHGVPGGPRVGGAMRPVPGPHAAWVYHGHPYAWHGVHYPHPWAYPPGFAYRLWAVGAILPPLFWAANSPYYYGGWADMGLPPPDPGFQYVEYGPDLLLVNVATGEVVQVFPGAFN